MREAFTSIAIKCIGSGLSFLTIALFSVFFNEGDVSKLSQIWSIVFISSILCIGGVNISIYSVRNFRKKYYVPALFSSIVLSIVFSIIVYKSINPFNVGYVYILMLIVSYSLSEVVSHILRRDGKIVLSLWPREVLWRALVFTVGNWVFYISSSLEIYILFISSAILAVSIYQITHVKLFVFGSFYNDLASLIRESKFPFLISALSILNTQAMIVYMFSKLPPSEVSIYFLVERTSNMMLFFLTSVSTYYNAKVALAASENKQYYVSQAALVAFFPILLLLLAFNVYYVSGCYYIESICRDDVFHIVLWLFLTQAVNAITGLSGFLVQYVGGAKHLFLFSLVTSIFLAIQQIISVNQQDLEAVAFLTFVHALLINGFSWCYVLFKSGYKSDFISATFFMIRRFNVRRKCQVQ